MESSEKEINIISSMDTTTHANKIMKKCLKCNEDLPNYVIVDGKRYNISKRVYCLICSPFKKRNRKRLHIIEEPSIRKCRRCEQEKEISEYAKIPKYTCKDCIAKHRKKIRLAFKQLCIDYKGGECEKCQYKKCIAALEFHHTNGDEKEFQISYRNKFTDKVKEELDKCQLLCANCHREWHFYNDGPIV